MALYVGEGSERGQCCCLTAGGLFSTCPASSRLHDWHPSSCCPGGDSQGGWICEHSRTCGPFKWTLLRDPQFLLPPQPPLVLTARSYETLFPGTRALQVWPGAHSPGILNVGQPALLAAATASAPPCHYHTTSSLPQLSTLPFLPVWMNVSSLNPWLSDFHTSWFSGSSGCFLFWGSCNASYGYARRQSMSPYVFILPGSPLCELVYSLFLFKYSTLWSLLSVCVCIVLIFRRVGIFVLVVAFIKLIMPLCNSLSFYFSFHTVSNGFLVW